VHLCCIHHHLLTALSTKCVTSWLVFEAFRSAASVAGVANCNAVADPARLGKKLTRSTVTGEGWTNGVTGNIVHLCLVGVTGQMYLSPLLEKGWPRMASDFTYRIVEAHSLALPR